MLARLDIPRWQPPPSAFSVVHPPRGLVDQRDPAHRRRAAGIHGALPRLLRAACVAICRARVTQT
jgi:hypothetical protein